MSEYINNTNNEYKENLNNKLGEIECNLDCTEYSLLNGESNTSNFITDIIRNSCQCDCVILSDALFLCDDDDDEIKSNDNDNEDFNINTSRTASNFNIDGTINKGDIKYNDIINKLYNNSNPIIILQLNGKQIRLAIEYGLSTNN